MAISLQICQAEAGARKVAEEGQSDKTMRPAWQIHSTQSGTRSPRVRVPPRPPPHSSWEYKTSALAARVQTKCQLTPFKRVGQNLFSDFFF